MLGFLKKQDSLLSKQKILKKNRIKKTYNFNLYKSTFILLLIFLSFNIYKNDFLNNKLSFLSNYNKLEPSEIIIISDKQNVISQEQYNNIIKNIENLKSSSFSISNLAKKIQESSNFSKVTVYKTLPQKIHVHIFERTPLLSIHADKHRLISKTGEVYGTFEKDEHASLVTLKNFFNKDRKNFSFLANNSLKLDEEEQKKINEALLVYHQSQKNNFKIKNITLLKFRGFLINIKDNPVNIILGRKPFTKKFIKLQKIIAQNETKDQELLTIELDFDGKAFIKKKNPKNTEKI